MPRELHFPFTPIDLECSRQSMAETFPDADPTTIEYGVANEVIINIFGRDCWGLKVTGSRPDPYFAATGDDGSLDAYVYQARITGLAHDLLVCQHFDGFAEQREQMSTRALLAVYHELRVARMLHDSGHAVAFVVPTGTKGTDHDLIVDGVLATEVKAKEDLTPYKRSALKGTLLQARSQLPSAGPGLIALRIPDAWARDAAFVAEADDLFREALRGSRRINGILVLWDEWYEGNPQGAACLVRFRTYENAQPRTDFADLPRVLRSIAVDGSMENADLELPEGDGTFVCTVRRHAGDGPLFETFDGGLQMVFDRGGFIANRVAGSIRVTSVPIASINGRWVHLVLRFGSAGADLFVDGDVIDSWSASAHAYKGFRIMPAVDGDLRRTLVYSARLQDGDVDQLFSYLSSQAEGAHVQFRRGDVARYRTGEPT